VLLLGPLAVAPDAQGRGIGSALMAHATKAARRSGAGAVILVGDAPTTAASASPLRRPARCGCRRLRPGRLLALELTAGALDGARGLVSASGKPEPKPSLSKLIAGLKAGPPPRGPVMPRPPNRSCHNPVDAALDKTRRPFRLPVPADMTPESWS